MKICLLTHTFPRFSSDIAAPFMGGVAQGLKDAGNEVFVLTPFSPEFKRNKSDQEYKVITYKYIIPLNLHKIGYSQTLSNDMKVKPIMYLLSPLLFWFGFFALLKLVRKEKIEIINAHWILPNGFVAVLVSLLTKVPVVSTLPGSDVYMAKKNLLFKLMAKFTIDNSAAITSNSPQLIEDLSKISTIKKKTEVIPYGVDHQKFKPENKHKNSIRRKLNIPKDDVVVVSVGRLVEKKGFKYLIQAAARVLEKSERTFFVIVGEGDERLVLEKMINKLKINDKVRITGWVDYQSLADYYNLADIYILPSVRDKVGNLDDQSVAVVEAMACGKPVITSNFPGYKLVVRDEENGFLVEQKNSNGIAKAITKLVSSPALCKKMGKESRILVMKFYTWERIGGHYTNLFKELLKN